MYFNKWSVSRRKIISKAYSFNVSIRLGLTVGLRIHSSGHGAALMSNVVQRFEGM